MIVGKYSHQFRIHILGIQGAYSFPVPVPLVPFSFSSSVCSVASYSIIDGNTLYSNTTDSEIYIYLVFFFHHTNTEEEEVLRDPPLLKEFLVHVVKKLCCGSDKLAVHLLNEDSRKNYIRAVKTQGREDDKDYTILFEEWKRKGTECTWQKIINALESVGENTLANNLKESYKNTSEVFLQ